MNPIGNSFIHLQLKLAVFIAFFLPLSAFCQLSKGGIPYSVKLNLPRTSVPVIQIPAPDFKWLAQEDDRDSKNGLPFRYAVNIPVRIDLLKESLLQELSNGDHLYRLGISSKGALALSCYFNDFYLPEGSSLFLYDTRGIQTIGSFSSFNNQDNGHFATELIHGDQLYLEFYEPLSAQGLSRLQLSLLSYAYRGVPFRNEENIRGFGGSGSCEVNINCPEGLNWQNQKRGVVKIAVKIGSSSYWCTGTLLNNVNQDYKPYILSADHCGSVATATDLSQWVFYFNYESLDCPNPILEPVAKTMTGAKKKASSGGGGSTIKESDLYLVLLNNNVPDNYNPFYCGWNRLNTSSTSGVTIHHPQGDIKKISTYVTPLISSSWGSTPGSHWSVTWGATQSGHGVTEPGSSGAPLFNSQGEVVGQLSGGESSCTNLTAGDLYGKFSYSWQPAGSDSSNSLHHWLDPSNSGALDVPGLAPDVVYVVTNFSVDEDTIIVGTTLNFIDLTSGNPDSWKWNFTGADPAFSSEKNPKNIAYNKAGVYPVSLIASNSLTSDTLVKKSYITVLPHVFPVPFDDHCTIDLGSQSTDAIQVQIFDILGREVKFLLHEDNPGTRYSVYLKNEISGVYYLKIKTSGLDLSKKIMFIKTASH